MSVHLKRVLLHFFRFMQKWLVFTRILQSLGFYLQVFLALPHAKWSGDDGVFPVQHWCTFFSVHFFCCFWDILCLFCGVVWRVCVCVCVRVALCPCILWICIIFWYSVKVVQQFFWLCLLLHLLHLLCILLFLIAVLSDFTVTFI